ncbi:MAG: hypothetical protein KGJ37_02780 [Verrucomicrobiota bacterium]|nr:hypothetical protein [Verrucomicrobiota bacterium]
MELSLESVAAPLSNFRPKTGSMEAWNAAYMRVEDYLRAHRVHNRLHQSRLIQKILERAAARHAEHPALSPTTLAAEETEAMMTNWFVEVLGARDRPQDRIAIEGRLALLLCDGSQKWPYAFLDEEHIPDEFAHDMQASSIKAGPDLAVSSMVPRPIELGPISEVAGGTLERFERWPVMRALLLWLFFLAALGLIFRFTR